MTRPDQSTNRRGLRSSTISTHAASRRRADQARSQSDDFHPFDFTVDRNGQLCAKVQLPFERTRSGLRLKAGAGLSVDDDGSLHLRLRRPLFLNKMGEIEAPAQLVSELVPDATVVAASVGASFGAVNAEIDTLRDATVADLNEIRDALVAAGLMKEE